MRQQPNVLDLVQQAVFLIETHEEPARVRAKLAEAAHVLSAAISLIQGEHIPDIDPTIPSVARALLTGYATREAEEREEGGEA